MRLQKKHIWYMISGILLTVQLGMGIVTVYELIMLNMLPEKYLVAGIVVLTALLALVAFLYLFRYKKKTKAIVAKSIATLLSLTIIVGCVAGTLAIARINVTVSEVAGYTIQSHEMAVYVMKDSSASSLSDLKTGSFGINDVYDVVNTQKMQEQVEKELNTSVKAQHYDSVNSMVDALYRGDVDAIILNQAYEPLLEEQEKYVDYVNDTRKVYTYSIEVQVASQKPQQNGDKEDNRSISQRPFTVYISGSDTRAKKLETSRSDVNILAVINPATKQVLLVNTPRDAYVKISIAPTERDKLTHCCLYGVDCSMDTLSALYNIEIDRYARINFRGFAQMIDAVGGVTVESPKSFTGVEGHYIEKGTNYLNGEEALDFVRERHHFGDGDFQRGRNQMQVIRQLIAKLSSASILTQYDEVLDSLGNTFVTDFSSAEMSELVKMQLNDGASWNVQTYTLMGEGKSRTSYSLPNLSTYVMIIDEDSKEYAMELMQRVYDGDILTEEDMVMPKKSSEE